MQKTCNLRQGVFLVASLIHIQIVWHCESYDKISNSHNSAELKFQISLRVFIFNTPKLPSENWVEELRTRREVGVMRKVPKPKCLSNQSVCFELTTVYSSLV